MCMLSIYIYHIYAYIYIYHVRVLRQRTQIVVGKSPTAIQTYCLCWRTIPLLSGSGQEVPCVRFDVGHDEQNGVHHHLADS